MELEFAMSSARDFVSSSVLSLFTVLCDLLSAFFILVFVVSCGRFVVPLAGIRVDCGGCSVEICFNRRVSSFLLFTCTKYAGTACHFI